MTREEKIQLVEQLGEQLKETPNIYVADAEGLTVEQVNELRQLCFDKGVKMQVVKNTLLKKALDKAEGDYEELYGSLKLPSSVFFVNEELANAPAKLLKEFRKKNEKPVLKGAWIETSVYTGDDQIEVLSKLKSKNELIGDVILLLQSPAKNVIGALQSGGQKLSGILKTLSEKES